MKPRRNSELIIAWAKGAQIQFLCTDSDNWYVIDYPDWFENVEYRIKPEPKPDVVRYAYTSGEHHYRIEQRGMDNIRLTFDGETGELKSAEVLK